MSRQRLLTTGNWFGEREVGVGLLERTQAYLRSLAAGQRPDGRSVDAWEWFYDVYNPMVRRWIMGRHLPDADLDDCVQHVWKEIVAKLPQLQFDPQRGRFCSWLATLVRRRTTAFLRKGKGDPVSTLGREASLVPCCRELDPAVAYQRQENRDVVHEAIAELRRQVSATSYQVLHLRCIEERTVSEIAASLDLTPEQVRYRCYRMKRRVKRAIMRGLRIARARSAG